MCCLSLHYGRTPKTCWYTSTFAYSRVEMGQGRYGLHHRLSENQKGNDDIFVVIDRLSKVAHFLPVRESITASQLADLYVSRVVSLHGVPLEINSDRGSLFTSRFWGSFQRAMGTHLSFSTAFHPQSSGQVERVNQILEDMLRACVI